MTTWNVITISAAPRLTEPKIDKAIARSGLSLYDAQVIEDHPGTWQVCGSSKYGPEGIQAFAADLSQRHPDSRVEVFQEWDSHDVDEMGSSLDVYVGGERVADSCREGAMVPVDLSSRVKAVEDALAGSGSLERAAQRLIDGFTNTP